MFLERYKESVEYIKKEFKLHDNASLYETVVRVTDAYKETKTLESLNKEKEQWQEKSQSKPVKSNSLNSQKQPRRKPGRPAKKS